MTQKKEKPKLEDGTNQKWIDFLSKGGKITEVGIWKDECYFSKKHDEKFIYHENSTLTPFFSQ